MSEDSSQRAVGIRNHGGTTACFGHGLQCLAHRGFRLDHGELFPLAHDIADTSEQSAAQRAARMQFGKVFCLKSTRFEQCHR